MGHPLHFMEGGVGVEGAWRRLSSPPCIRGRTGSCKRGRAFVLRTGAFGRGDTAPALSGSLERLSKGQRRDPCTTWPSGPPEHRDKEGETGWSACPKDKGATRVPHGRQALPSTETRRGRQAGAPVQRTKARPVYHMAVRPSRAQRQGGGDRLERLSKGQRRDPCTTWPSGPPEHRDKEGETDTAGVFDPDAPLHGVEGVAHVSTWAGGGGGGGWKNVW
jgi:hypothetical protein